MAEFDLPLEQLREYRNSTPEPDDFDLFWLETLRDARRHQVLIAVEEYETALTEFLSWDVRFSGFNGDAIAAWYTRPASAAPDEKLPIVVEYLGYGGGRGLPHERLTFAAAGYAHLLVDSRGQGGQHGSGGDTTDPWPSSPSANGVLTRGITDQREHCYRRLVTDAVRAVDAARELPGVDPDRVIVTGNSQGGYLALAAGGLSEGITATAANVPFMCDPVRALRITESAPWSEIVSYLSVNRGHEEQAMRTLAYVDGAAFARRGHSPLHITTGLRDTVCPPSTVFAAANAWGEDTGTSPSVTTEVYRFNHHEGGGAFNVALQLDWLRSVLGSDA
ncbi:MAG: acetylxylan esterase [Mycetocola sp.]